MRRRRCWRELWLALRRRARQAAPLPAGGLRAETLARIRGCGEKANPAIKKQVLTCPDGASSSRHWTLRSLASLRMTVVRLFAQQVRSRLDKISKSLLTIIFVLTTISVLCKVRACTLRLWR
jgi:hypothetical protein